MTSSNKAHDKGDPLSKPLEETLLEKFISLVNIPHNAYILDNQINGTTALRAFHYRNHCLYLTIG